MVSWQAWKNRCLGALLMAAVSTQVAAGVGPTLSFTATPNPAVQGSSVALNIAVTNIVDLYAYQFTLSFNPALLQATGVSEGAFLATGGTTFFGGGSIDNTLGSISLVFDTLIGDLSGVSGSGVLATLNFNAIAVGTSALTFSDTMLLDANLADIAVGISNGSLQVSPVPEPAAWMLFGAGLAGLASARRRKLS